jgi:hypothetical protein
VYPGVSLRKRTSRLSSVRPNTRRLDPVAKAGGAVTSAPMNATASAVNLANFFMVAP